MPSVGFEPTISAGERPQTYALDRAATGTGKIQFHTVLEYSSVNVMLGRATLCTVSLPLLYKDQLGNTLQGKYVLRVLLYGSLSTPCNQHGNSW